jgi:hypothetical protein
MCRVIPITRAAATPSARDALVQCVWVHIVQNGNFENDLTDAVVYLCRFATGAFSFAFVTVSTHAPRQWRLFGCSKRQRGTGERNRRSSRALPDCTEVPVPACH